MGDVRSVLGLPPRGKCQSVYFGTPSRKFPGDITKKIIQDVIQSVRNRVYDMALLYREDLQGQACSDLRHAPVGQELNLLAQNPEAEVLEELSRLADSKVSQPWA